MRGVKVNCDVPAKATETLGMQAENVEKSRVTIAWERLHFPGDSLKVYKSHQ